MNKLISLIIGVGIAVAFAVGASTGMFSDSASEQAPSTLDINYDLVNSNLKQSLDEKSISMSSPIEFSGQNTIEKYCTLFKDSQKQDLIKFCTSTELLDSDGNFLGNINVAGNASEPAFVVALLQMDPFLNQADTAKLVTDLILDEIVCDCWEQQRPAGFSSSDSWIDALIEYHTVKKNQHSSAPSLTLNDKQIQLEISTNTSGYVLTLLVS